MLYSYEGLCALLIRRTTCSTHTKDYALYSYEGLCALLIRRTMLSTHTKDYVLFSYEGLCALLIRRTMRSTHTKDYLLENNTERMSTSSRLAASPATSSGRTASRATEGPLLNATHVLWGPQRERPASARLRPATPPACTCAWEAERNSPPHGASPGMWRRATPSYAVAAIAACFRDQVSDSPSISLRVPCSCSASLADSRTPAASSVKCNGQMCHAVL